MVPVCSLAEVQALHPGRLNTSALDRACRAVGAERVFAGKCFTGMKKCGIIFYQGGERCEH